MSHKNIAGVLITLIMALPVASLAGALERYYVPQQMSEPAQPAPKARSGGISEDVYTRFKAEIQGYDREKRNKLETQFRSQLKNAMREKNDEAVSHYERLIGILNSDK